MEIWIRSQNKLCLIKVNNIDVVIRGEDFYITTNYRELENGTKYWDLLGKYKTKERALEILDEISEFIDNVEKAIIYSNMPVEDYTKIYKMPEE